MEDFKFSSTFPCVFPKVGQGWKQLEQGSASRHHQKIKTKTILEKVFFNFCKFQNTNEDYLGEEVMGCSFHKTDKAPVNYVDSSTNLCLSMFVQLIISFSCMLRSS